MTISKDGEEAESSQKLTSATSAKPQGDDSKSSEPSSASKKDKTDSKKLDKKKKRADSKGTSSSRSSSRSSSTSGSSSRSSSSDSSASSGSSTSSKSHSRSRGVRRRSRSPRRRRRSPTPPPRPSKVFVGKLTRNVNKEHLQEIFSVYGTVRSVDLPYDRFHPHLTRGIAYIEFEKHEEADDAVKHMHGGQIDGQEITASTVLAPRERVRPPLVLSGHRSPPMRRFGGGMPRIVDHRLGRGRGGGSGGYRRRSPISPRRRPRTRSRSRSRSAPRRSRRHSRSSSASSR